MALNGIFQDVTSAAGFTFLGRTHGMAWGDFNGDSYPDIFIGNHDSAVGNDNPNAVNLYLNQQDGTFVEVASNSIDVYEELVGADSHDLHFQAFIDFDNDGDRDLFLPEHSRVLPDRLLVNDGGFLSDRADELGFSYPDAVSHNALFFDYNQDSLLDVFIATTTPELPSTVFSQNSNNVYEDVGSTVLPSSFTSTYAVLGDVSNDGNLDVIVEGGSIVYDTTTEPFTDITEQIFSGNRVTGVDAITGDFNGDLQTDLYVTRNGFSFNDVNQVSPTELDFNIGEPRGTQRGITFETEGIVTLNLLETLFARTLDEIFIGSNSINPTETQLILDPNDPDVRGIPSYTPGVDSGIFIGYEPSEQTWEIIASNETLLELSFNIESTEAISNINAIGFDPDRPPATDKLLFNTGNGLEEVSIESGIRDIPVYGRNVVAGDFDNDMDLDLYLVNTKGITNLPNVLIENQGDGTFVQVNNGGGAPGPNDSVGSGDNVSVADYDLDGFLDLFVTNGFRPREYVADAPYQLYRNQGNDNSWLQIDLQGVQSNRDGIGAKVFVTAGGITQVREQTGGVHYKSQDQQRLHFGLSENTTAERIVVQWPSGITQQIDSTAANQIIEIVEEDNTGGNSIPVAVDDTATAESGVAVNIDVLANDSDADGNELRLSIDTPASNGTVVVNDNGTPNNFSDDSITYTPDDDFTGTDEFVYEVADFFGGRDTASVSLSVIPKVPNTFNGTEGSDTLQGTTEEDILNGLGSGDVLRGFAGNDTLNGGEGNDNLQGGFNSDVLNGNEGNDILLGGFDRDTLIGGEGSDRFRFVRTDDGIDEITDFTPSEDTIQIKGSNFGGLFNGVLDSSQFVLGTTAVDSDDRFIYNQNNGSLFFDLDGVGGESQIQLATLSNNANLSASDIVIFGGTTPPPSTAIEAIDDTAITQENQAVSIDVLDNDENVDSDSLSLSINTVPSNGTAVVDDNGTPNNVLDDEIIYTPDTDFTGDDQFDYLIDDGNGNTDTATVAVIVNSDINGTEGRDTLQGTSGDDLINGLGDRDVIKGFAGRDTLNGGEGNDNLQGGFNDDVLNGDGGNDLIITGFGNDVVTGGEGSDRVRFSKIEDGVDEITDFTIGEDTLEFKASNFGNLDTGTLASDRFVTGSAAVDSDDRFIYNQSNGNFSYDPDGVGGEEQTLLVVLSNNAEIGENDINIF